MSADISILMYYNLQVWIALDRPLPWGPHLDSLLLDDFALRLVINFWILSESP